MRVGALIDAAQGCFFSVKGAQAQRATGEAKQLELLGEVIVFDHELEIFGTPTTVADGGAIVQP